MFRAIISRITGHHVAVQQLGVGVVRRQLLLLLLLPAPPAVPLVHGEQHHEDDEEEHRDARGYQDPNRAGLLGLHLLLDDGRALVVQLERTIAELHVGAILGRRDPRPVGAVEQLGLHLDLTQLHPGVERLTLAAAELDHVAGEIEVLERAERRQVLGVDRGDRVLRHVEGDEIRLGSDARDLGELVLGQLQHLNGRGDLYLEHRVGELVVAEVERAEARQLEEALRHGVAAVLREVQHLQVLLLGERPFLDALDEIVAQIDEGQVLVSGQALVRQFPQSVHGSVEHLKMNFFVSARMHT